MNYTVKISSNEYGEKTGGKMYYIGIDIGSTAAKTAVFYNGEFIHFFSQPTGWSSLETAESILKKLELLSLVAYGLFSSPHHQRNGKK